MTNTTHFCVFPGNRSASFQFQLSIIQGKKHHGVSKRFQLGLTHLDPQSLDIVCYKITFTFQ